MVLRIRMSGDVIGHVRMWQDSTMDFWDGSLPTTFVFPPISSGLACFGGISLNPFWPKATKKKTSAPRFVSLAWRGISQVSSVRELIRPVVMRYGWNRSDAGLSPWSFCWWKKTCTSWYGKCPIMYRVLYIPGGASFLPSTVRASKWAMSPGIPNRSEISRKKSSKVQPKELKIHNSKRRTRTTSTKTNCK